MLATGTRTASNRSIPRHRWCIFCAIVSWCLWIFSYFGIPGRSQPNYAASSSGKASVNEALQSRSIHAQQARIKSEFKSDVRIKAHPKDNIANAIRNRQSRKTTGHSTNSKHRTLNPTHSRSTKTPGPLIRHTVHRSTRPVLQVTDFIAPKRLRFAILLFSQESINTRPAYTEASLARVKAKHRS